MKKLIIGLFVLSSFSSFAYHNCEIKYSSKTHDKINKSHSSEVSVKECIDLAQDTLDLNEDINKAKIKYRGMRNDRDAKVELFNH